MVEMFRLGCRAVRRELWDYAGERLSEGPMEQVERHLNRCAACRQEVRAMREAQKLLSVCREETPPSRAGWSDLRSRLVVEGLAEREPVASGWRREARLIRRPDLGSASPRLGWLPRLSIASGFAAFLMMAAIAYRVSLPRKENPASDPSVPSVLPNDPSRVTNNGWENIFSSPLQAGLFGAGDPLPAITSETGTEKPKRDTVVKNDTHKPEPDEVKPNEENNRRPEKRTKPKNDSEEYHLEKNDAGKLHYVPGGKNEKKIVGIDKPVSPSTSDSSRGYDMGGDGYIMGTLTPVSHEDGAY